MFRAVLELSAIAVLLVEDILKQQSLKKRKRRIRRNRTKWVKSWIRQREAHGAFPNLCRELEFNEVPDFRNFARLFPVQFHMLEELITPIIQRENTNYRDCISVGTRLMVMLRFLATGESFRSLSYQFRVGVSTIRQFVPETCTAIYEVLKEKYLKCPDTVEEWQQVADGFQAQWDFPNCLGALDGKHINIRPPPGTGSTYFNYKHTFSIVLKALVDSNYKFLYVDVGCNGRISDGGVFGGCSLQDALENRTFNIPAPAPLPASDQAVCYHIVADEAFPLKEYLMKPYPNRRLAVEQRIFNYRLSRARRVVENAFGILANRFRVFLTTINIQDTAKVEAIVLACCALTTSCAQRTVAHTWRELLTRKDLIMALSQEAGDKTLTYGKPPCHPPPIIQLEPSITGMNYANILPVSVQCLFSGIRYSTIVLFHGGLAHKGVVL